MSITEVPKGKQLQRAKFLLKTIKSRRFKLRQAFQNEDSILFFAEHSLREHIICLNKTADKEDG